MRGGGKKLREERKTRFGMKNGEVKGKENIKSKQQKKERSKQNENEEQK